MKKIHVLYGAIIGVLLLVIAGLVYKFLLAGKTVTTEDRRTAIIMEPAERAFVLEEMRALLDAIRAMTDAVARDDMKKVAAAARAAGPGAGAGPPARGGGGRRRRSGGGWRPSCRWNSKPWGAACMPNSTASPWTPRPWATASTR